MGVTGGGALSPTGPSALLLLVYMAFISAAAYSVWSLLLTVNSVSRISVYGFMNPVFGFVLSAVLLGEYQLVDSVRSICALVLVSAGIVVVNRIGTKTGGSSEANRASR